MGEGWAHISSLDCNWGLASSAVCLFLYNRQLPSLLSSDPGLCSLGHVGMIKERRLRMLQKENNHNNYEKLA